MGSEIAAGIRYVVMHPLLRPIAICTSVSNLFNSMAFAVLVLFAVRELDLPPGAIGIAFAIGNVGVLVGAALADRIGRTLGVGRAIVGSSFLLAAAGFFPPLADTTTGIAMIAISVALSGFGSVVYNVGQVSLRQAITPQRMLGKMNATMRFIVWGTMPIGALLGGVFGDAIGLRPTLWVAAVGGAAAIVPPLLSPVRSLVRIPSAEPEAQPAS
jgi:MFS family permease